MRVLFQIFSGAATDITVANTVSISHQFQCGSIANSHFGVVAITSATRPSSSPTQASSGNSSHDIFAWRASRKRSRGIFKKVNGPKFHKSSLFGIAWRINPPSKPAVAAAGIPSHSCPISAGMVMIAPPIGTHDAAAEQTHQERAFERQVREPVRKSDHPQRHADNQAAAS